MNTALLYLLTELKRRGGSARDKELFEYVKKHLEYMGKDISKTEFVKALMTLEVRGFIRVEHIKKNTWMVYLVKDDY